MSLEELSDLLLDVYRKKRSLSELLEFLTRTSEEDPLKILIEAYKVSIRALKNKVSSSVKIVAGYIENGNWEKPGDIIKYALKIGISREDLEEMLPKTVLVRFGATIYFEVVTRDEDSSPEEYPIMYKVIRKLSSDRNPDSL